MGPGQVQVHGAARITRAGLAPHPRQDGCPPGSHLKIRSARAAEHDPGTGDRYWVTHVNKKPRAGLQAAELRRAVPIGGPSRGRARVDRHGCGLGIVAGARAGRPERRSTDRSKYLGRRCRCPGFAGVGTGAVAWACACAYPLRLRQSWLVRDESVSRLEWKTAMSATASTAHTSTRAIGQRGRRARPVRPERVGSDRRQRVSRDGVVCFCHGRVYSRVGRLGRAPGLRC